VALGLYAVLAVVAFGYYLHTLTRQIAAYETSGPEDGSFVALSARSRVLGIVLGVIVLAIIVVMVLKPGT